MKDRDQEGYYSLLGVGPEATPAEIKAAYQAALAAADGPGLEFVKKAAEQAYAVLGDATARQAYDPAWSHTGSQRVLLREQEAPGLSGWVVLIKARRLSVQLPRSVLGWALRTMLAKNPPSALLVHSTKLAMKSSETLKGIT